MTKRYMIKEIFGPTIQGEGSNSGMPVMFLRFSGCNRWSGRPEDKQSSICSFCDTDFLGGDRLTAEQIVSQLVGKQVTRSHVNVLVISGGEPLLQLDEDLCKKLHDAGFRLHLETNGSKALGPLARFMSHISMGPKQAFHETRLEYCHDIKILYPYISEHITEKAFEKFLYTALFFQPLMDENYEQNLQKTIRKTIDVKNARISLQTHKIMGLA